MTESIHSKTKAKLEKRQTSKEEPGSVYLRLLHGRDDPKEDMDDWGYQGPSIGPLKFCHVTYLSSISLGFVDGFETGVLLRKEEGLCFEGDLIYFQDSYYGDWEVCVA